MIRGSIRTARQPRACCAYCGQRLEVGQPYDRRGRSRDTHPDCTAADAERTARRKSRGLAKGGGKAKAIGGPYGRGGRVIRDDSTTA